MIIILVFLCATVELSIEDRVLELKGFVYYPTVYLAVSWV